MPALRNARRVRPAPDQVAARLATLFVGSRGGATRRRVARALAARPRNANRLAGALDLDYKTVRHHLSVLREAGAVTRSGDGYGAVYVLTADTRRHWDLVDVDADGAADGHG